MNVENKFRISSSVCWLGSDFLQVISAWESATELIVRREELMVMLENFERVASDPNRFFEKGSRGSSVARLEEAKQRSYLHKVNRHKPADSPDCSLWLTFHVSFPLPILQRWRHSRTGVFLIIVISTNVYKCARQNRHFRFCFRFVEPQTYQKF